MIEKCVHEKRSKFYLKNYNPNLEMGKHRWPRLDCIFFRAQIQYNKVLTCI